MNVRFRVFAGSLAAAFALSGCGSVKSMFAPTPSEPSADALAAAPQTAADFDCPSVEIRSGAATLSVVGGKASTEGTGPELRYQGSIVRTARECSLNAGVVGVRVGIEGRIVIGPAGGPGQLDVPIRVAVVHEGPNPKTITTKLYRTTVVVPPDQGNSNFSYVAEDLSFPMPRAGDIDRYVIYLGFDPQPEQRSRPAPRKPAPKRTRAQS